MSEYRHSSCGLPPSMSRVKMRIPPLPVSNTVTAADAVLSALTPVKAVQLRFHVIQLSCQQYVQLLQEKHVEVRSMPIIILNMYEACARDHPLHFPAT